MVLTFLGTSSNTPTRKRNVSSLALTFDQKSTWWLFDCGEGTQHQIQQTSLKLGRLERIFITHLDGDHIFGLPGLLASRSLQDSAELPLVVTGPAGIDKYIEASLRLSDTHLGYPLNVEILCYPPDAPEEDPSASKWIGPIAHALPADSGQGVHVDFAPMEHGSLCFGYSVVESDKPGALDVARLKEIGVPSGPLLGRLKAGETVTLDDGRTIEGLDYIGPDVRGRRVVICGDTRPCDNAVALARDADVLVHEATFSDSDADLAHKANHSTAAQAATTARKANARTLILTHFSPRYDDTGPGGINDLAAEARAIFPNTLVASDLWSYEINRRP